MVIAAMMVALLTMAAFDARLSAKRMAKLGPSVELNPLARRVFERFGAKGLMILIVGMTAVIGGGLAFVSPLLLAGFVGVRLALLMFQLRSMSIESPQLPS